MKPLLIVLFLTLIFIACNTKENVDGKESESVSPPKLDLHQAIYMRDLDAIKQHIKAGSDLDSPEPSFKSSPLITAAALGEPEAAKLLIDAGADINYTNMGGSNALHTAIVFGKENVAKILIDSGTKLDTKNNEGSSPLHTAAFFCEANIVEYLLEKGAEKSQLNSNGNTALEIVNGPFEKVKGIYDQVGSSLKPLGIEFDYEHIEKTRPIIAEMLR